jgi:hypothetical protein
LREVLIDSRWTWPSADRRGDQAGRSSATYDTEDEERGRRRQGDQRPGEAYEYEGERLTDEPRLTLIACVIVFLGNYSLGLAPSLAVVELLPMRWTDRMDRLRACVR